MSFLCESFTMENIQQPQPADRLQELSLNKCEATFEYRFLCSRRWTRLKSPLDISIRKQKLMIYKANHLEPDQQNKPPIRLPVLRANIVEIKSSLFAPWPKSFFRAQVYMAWFVDGERECLLKFKNVTDFEQIRDCYKNTEDAHEDAISKSRRNARIAKDKLRTSTADSSKINDLYKAHHSNRKAAKEVSFGLERPMSTTDEAVQSSALESTAIADRSLVKVADEPQKSIQGECNDFEKTMNDVQKSMDEFKKAIDIATENLIRELTATIGKMLSQCQDK